MAKKFQVKLILELERRFVAKTALSRAVTIKSSPVPSPHGVEQLIYLIYCHAQRASAVCQ